MPIATAPKQHQAGAYHRKILLRRQLLRFAKPGAAYVPFIGDGDIAVDVYGGRKVYGADMDQARARIAGGRLAGSEVRVADCNGWPFAGRKLQQLALADFDPYRNPYIGFRAFWDAKPKLASTFCIVFTDGQRQALMRVGKWEHPDGSQVEGTLNERRAIFHAYLSGQVWPWFAEYVKPWEVVHKVRYMHGWMVYWGAVLRKPTSRADTISTVARAKKGKLTPAKRRELLVGITQGMRLTGASAMVGLERAVVVEQLGSDEKFAREYAAAQDQAAEAVEESLYQAAVSGNVQACRMWLELNSGGQAAPSTEVAPTGASSDRLARVNALMAGESDPFDAELDGVGTS